jgi:ABC-type antimicrobial peptide transport system permease subunit
MESYNFLLSFFRLRKKIKFKLSIFLPIVSFASAGLSSALTGRIFSFGGASAPVLWLSLKIVFAVSLTVFFISVTGLLKSQIKNDFYKTKTAKEE